MHKTFHLSIGVKSLEESIDFFGNTLKGKVTVREKEGGADVDLFGSQIFLKSTSNVEPNLPHFHFGFNLSDQEFDELSQHLLETAPKYIQSPPHIVDEGTELERKKMYLKSPTGYLIEFKGFKL